MGHINNYKTFKKINDSNILNESISSNIGAIMIGLSTMLGTVSANSNFDDMKNSTTEYSVRFNGKADLVKYERQLDELISEIDKLNMDEYPDLVIDIFEVIKAKPNSSSDFANLYKLLSEFTEKNGIDASIKSDIDELFSLIDKGSLDKEDFDFINSILKKHKDGVNGIVGVSGIILIAVLLSIIILLITGTGYSRW